MTGRNLLLTLLGVFLSSLVSSSDLSRAVDIQNQSGNTLEVYWVNPRNGKAIRYSDLRSGAKLAINSYVNHTFMVRDGEGETCNSEDEDCHVNYITVTESDHQSK